MSQIYRATGAYRTSVNFAGSNVSPNQVGGSRTYRNSGPYRDGLYTYRGAATNIADLVMITRRAPIAAPRVGRFKLEQVTLPGGRTADVLVTI